LLACKTPNKSLADHLTQNSKRRKLLGMLFILKGFYFQPTGS